MLCDRCRRDEVLVAERCLDASAIEMPLRTIALNAAWGPRMASVLVPSSGLIYREGELAVGGCRDGASFIALMIPQPVAPLAGYPQGEAPPVLVRFGPIAEVGLPIRPRLCRARDEGKYGKNRASRWPLGEIDDVFSLPPIRRDVVSCRAL
jgi:hypothetical protein